MENLSTIKTTAVLVNTSKADLVEADALIALPNCRRPVITAIDILKSGHILQCYALFRLEYCICALYMGCIEQDSNTLRFTATFNNIRDFIRRIQTNSINPGALQMQH